MLIQIKSAKYIDNTYAQENYQVTNGLIESLWVVNRAQNCI